LAQDSQLFEHTWLLQELSIEDSSITAPNPSLDNELVFIINSNGNDVIEIFHSSCDGAYGIDIDSYDGEEGFTAISISAPFGEECNSPDLEEFLQAHGRLFYGDPVTGTTFNPFTYEITSSGDEITLVITNGNGDVATYGNFALSLKDNQLSQSHLLYHPENEYISFTGLQEEALLSLYNLNRQKQLEASINNSQTIDLSSLSKGVYFAVVVNQDNQRVTRKFVKY